VLFVCLTVFYVCSVDVYETDGDAYCVHNVYDNLRAAVNDHLWFVNNTCVDTVANDGNGVPFDHAYHNTPLGVTRYETWDDVLDVFPDNDASFNRYHGPLFPPQR